MASITKRGRVWRVEVWLKGVRITATRDTEAEAIAWAATQEGAPASHIKELTVASVFDRYAREISPEKNGARWELVRLAALARDPIFGCSVASIDGSVLARWRDARLRTVSPATVNRELNLISAVFSRAQKEWRLPIVKNPVSDIQRPRQPPGRRRRVSDDERDAIVRQLGWDGRSPPADLNEWVAWTFCFALETAMRQGEILSMRRRDLGAKSVHLSKTKNGQARDVPLTSRALALLALLPIEGDRLVPLEAGTCGAYFREAVVGAAIQDLHFHDTRHEAITRFAEKLSIMELARVSGHMDTRMLLGYYHPTAADLADKME